jgi:hypothetical protein
MLRQLFAGLELSANPATAEMRQSIEQKLNSRRQTIDTLAIQGQFTEALLLEDEDFED